MAETISHQQLEAYLQIAKTASLKAGSLLRSEFERLKEVKVSLEHDRKTEADQASERLIREELSCTGLPVIGEEEGGDATLLKRNELYWAVDPLDGTLNYLARLPLCAVSIGLMRGLSPVLGVVYDFNHNELFWGAVGVGAFCNERKLLPAESFEAQTMMAGWDKRSLNNRKRIEFSKKYFVQARSLGSAALQHAWVADGRLVFSHYGAKIWDQAGGMGVVAAMGAETEIVPLGNFDVAVTTHNRRVGVPGPLLEQQLPSVIEKPDRNDTMSI